MKPMTLVFSVQSRDTLWVVADRQLSYGAGWRPKPDAVKIVNLETIDGVGVLAYAGLGATSKGTQPSEWISAVLRGRGGMTFEQTLGVLATVATRELPRHLESVPGGAHFIIAPAFIQGIGSRLYTIDNVVDLKEGQHRYRYASHQHTDIPGSPGVRIAATGTGGVYIFRKKDRVWQRELLSLVKHHDRGKISDHVIADKLASLNYEAHKELKDTVGPRSIVVWRRRRDARRGRPGGGHQFYTGISHDLDWETIPTIANGMDTQAIARIFIEQFQRQITNDGLASAAFGLDIDQINRRVAAIPSDPDEKLR